MSKELERIQTVLKQISQILEDNGFDVRDRATLAGLSTALYIYNKGE